MLVALGACGRIGFSDLVGGPGAPDASDAPQLGLTATPPTINLGSKAQLAVTGGTPPYTFTVAGAGVMVGSAFVAPSRAGESTVQVTDAVGAMGSTVVSYHGDQIFVVGGIVAGTEDASVLVSSDGGVTWSQAGSLPAPRANGALVVYDDAMIFMGGLSPAGAPTPDVYRSTDGSTWTRIGSLPIANTGFTATVHLGEIWFVGGATSAGNGGTAYHSADGITWTAAPAAMPVVRHEHDTFSRDGSLYVLGGHGDAGFLDDIAITTDGTSWSAPAERLTFASDFPAAGELGDLVIRTCGTGCTSTETSTDLIHWTAAAPLPDGDRESPALLGIGDRMLLIGGGSTVQATTDGSAWTQIGALPASRTRTGAVQFTPH